MEKACFGIDVGGTAVKIGLFDQTGSLLSVNSIPTRKEENGKWITEDIYNAMENILQEQKISKENLLGVGIGLPGPVTSDGKILGCVNLGWGIVTHDELVEKFHGIPVFPLNDANAAALGEMWRVSGSIAFESTDSGSCKDMVFITLGTGVGGGVVSDGRLICGANGGAGEIGHFPVNSHETESCTCGKKGCLEQYCSATGVVRIAKKCISEYDVSFLKTIENITAKDVFDGAKAGDKCCLDIVDKFGRYLAKGCAYIASMTNPEIIIIGGGVSKAGDIIISAIEKYFKEFAFPPCAGVKFVLAGLGNDAGMYGCAYAVLKK